VAVAGNHPLVSCEISCPHRSAGVEFVGADADFRAQAIFAAIGEAGAGVDEDAGAVDFGGEFLDGLRVAAEDGVGVVRAVVIDVVDGFLDTAYDLDADGEGEVFGVPILGRGGFGEGKEFMGGLIGTDFHIFGSQGLADSVDQSRGGVAVDEEVLDGVTDRAAGITGLGVYTNVFDHLFHAFGGAVDVNVAVAGEMFEHRDGRISDDGADERFTASGDDEIDVSVLFEDEGHECAIGGIYELNGVIVCGFLDDLYDGFVAVECFFAAAQDGLPSPVSGIEGRNALSLALRVLERIHDHGTRTKLGALSAQPHLGR